MLYDFITDVVYLRIISSKLRQRYDVFTNQNSNILLPMQFLIGNLQIFHVKNLHSRKTAYFNDFNLYERAIRSAMRQQIIFFYLSERFSAFF